MSITTPILFTIAANTIISFISLVGILFSSRSKKTLDSLDVLVSFAAGVMLTTALASTLPEALESSDIHMILGMTLIGVIVSFLMERFLLWYHHHHEDTHSIKPSAFLVLFGDALHNFIDGFVIAATFLVSVPLGITTTIAIAAHELPQEIADYFVLIHSGFDKNKALLYNFISALTAIMGGVVGFIALERFETISPFTLAFSAGIFIYIACADLIPELHHKAKKHESIRQAFSFLFGVILMFCIILQAGHSHETEQKIEKAGTQACQTIQSTH